MIEDIKKASPLATLALVGALAGCSDRPKEYTALIEDDISENQYFVAPIMYFRTPEIGDKIGMGRTIYLQDVDNDGKVDAIGLGYSVNFVADEDLKESMAGTHQGTAVMSPEAREIANRIREDNIRLNVLLSQSFAEQQSAK